MASQMHCDVCQAEPGVLLITNLSNGDVMALGATCAPQALRAFADTLEPDPDAPDGPEHGPHNPDPEGVDVPDNPPGSEPEPEPAPVSEPEPETPAQPEAVTDSGDDDDDDDDDEHADASQLGQPVSAGA